MCGSIENSVCESPRCFFICIMIGVRDNNNHLNEEVRMPYVNIKITREGASAEQKAELIAGVTALLQNVLHKNPATTVVVIDEVDVDNWGIGGESVAVRRSQGL